MIINQIPLRAFAINMTTNYEFQMLEKRKEFFNFIANNSIVKPQKLNWNDGKKEPFDIDRAMIPCPNVIGACGICTYRTKPKVETFVTLDNERIVTVWYYFEKNIIANYSALYELIYDLSSQFKAIEASAHLSASEEIDIVKDNRSFQAYRRNLLGFGYDSKCGIRGLSLRTFFNKKIVDDLGWDLLKQLEPVSIVEPMPDGGCCIDLHHKKWEVSVEEYDEAWQRAYRLFKPTGFFADISFPNPDRPTAAKYTPGRSKDLYTLYG